MARCLNRAPFNVYVRLHEWGFGDRKPLRAIGRRSQRMDETARRRLAIMGHSVRTARPSEKPRGAPHSAEAAVTRYVAVPFGSGANAKLGRFGGVNLTYCWNGRAAASSFIGGGR